jgi:hypothetical protein
MKLGILVYIMAPEPTSTAYFINPSHQVKVTLRPTISRSVSPGFEPHLRLYIYTLIVARRRLGDNVTAATNTHETIK